MFWSISLSLSYLFIRRTYRFYSSAIEHSKTNHSTSDKNSGAPFKGVNFSCLGHR